MKRIDKETREEILLFRKNLYQQLFNLEGFKESFFIDYLSESRTREKAENVFKIFRLYIIEGKTRSETAEMCNTSEAVVDKQVISVAGAIGKYIVEYSSKSKPRT